MFTNIKDGALLVVGALILAAGFWMGFKAGWGTGYLRGRIINVESSKKVDNSTSYNPLGQPFTAEEVEKNFRVPVPRPTPLGSQSK